MSGSLGKVGRQEKFGERANCLWPFHQLNPRVDGAILDYLTLANDGVSKDQDGKIEYRFAVYRDDRIGCGDLAWRTKLCLEQTDCWGMARPKGSHISGGDRDV